MRRRRTDPAEASTSWAADLDDERFPTDTDLQLTHVFVNGDEITGRIAHPIVPSGLRSPEGIAVAP
ncbi:hypothetical protein ACIRQQ_38545 [Streptomyces fuscichromogenes]|uniref:hypothetical protein n=1 Tax=Streptomyces fuscichromogenes TaxID=1324013 RepID=UPI0037FA9074